MAWSVCNSIVSVVIFFKQKTAYEMRISDWSSDVCSSDLSPLDIPDVQGVKLDGETQDTRPPADDAPFSALAFKIMNDPFVGSLTFARIYSGKLEKGTYINSVQDKKEKIGRKLLMQRSEERREGKEGVRTRRTGWSAYT